MLTPADICQSVEYQLDRRATALRRAGDWDGAIAALRQRKALLGLQWDNDKLAKYLQRAGRFDEALAEIDWLLEHSQARARELLGHQPVSLQQSQHAGYCARLHASAALICKREGRADLQAQHRRLAERYGAIWQRLEPIARADAKEARLRKQEEIAEMRRRFRADRSRSAWRRGAEEAPRSGGVRGATGAAINIPTGANVKRFELQQQLVERTLGLALESTRPVDMSIEEVTQALWPLNERFRPHLAQIQSLAYDQRLEGAADGAVERLVLHGAAWDGEPSGVWRVLLERHLQVMQLLALKAGEAGSWTAPFLSVPEPADAALRARLAIVFVLHSTPLPFAVAERSGAALPQGNAPGTLTRH